MVSKQLLDILVCPEDHSSLSAVNADEIERINRLIAAGKVMARGGEPVAEPLQEGLVRADGQLLYPVRDGIPVMLVDEAIPLSQLEASEP